MGRFWDPFWGGFWGVFWPYYNTFTYGNGGIWGGGFGGYFGGYSGGVYLGGCMGGGGFCPGGRFCPKNRNSILSRLGELLNTLQNVHPPGGGGPGGAPRGAPPGGPPRATPASAILCTPTVPECGSVSDPRYPSRMGIVQVGPHTHRRVVCCGAPTPHGRIPRTPTLTAVGYCQTLELLACWDHDVMAWPFSHGVLTSYSLLTPTGCNRSTSRRWLSLSAMTASSSGLWLSKPGSRGGIPRPMRWVLATHVTTWCHSATGGVVTRRPLGPLILGVQKSAHFCPPAVQSRGGVGGLRPLT